MPGRDYEVEATVVADMVARHWLPGANTLVFYGPGSEAMVERMVVAKLGALVGLTEALFVDRIPVHVPPQIDRDHGGGPVPTVVVISVSEARGHLRETGAVVGAVVAVQQQVVAQSVMLQRDLAEHPRMAPLDKSWNRKLLFAAEVAALAGLLWDAGDAPYVGYNQMDTENPADVRQAIRASGTEVEGVVDITCRARGVMQGRSVMALVREAAAYYRGYYQDRDMLEHAWPAPLPLEYDLLFHICAKMGPALVDRVAGDDVLGGRIKRIAHSRNATVVVDHQDTMVSTAARLPRWAISQAKPAL